MTEVIGQKTVKTRKDHVCFGCGRNFSKGTLMERSCVIDSDGIWTCFLCPTCKKISASLKYGDEFGFGELREEALRKDGGADNG